MAADPVSDEIRALEERLLQLGVRHSPGELDRLLADDFSEFGSSGRVFDKPAIIRSLAAELGGGWRYSLEEFRVVLLAPSVALATYRLVGHEPPDEPRHALRSSIWTSQDGSWRLVFHQGTRSSAAG